MTEDEIVVTFTPPKGTDHVKVPAGGKFAGIYYDEKRRQHYAVVHHPINPGAAVEVTEARMTGGTLTIGSDNKPNADV